MKNELKGKKFGRLIVIKDSKKRQFRHVIWLCKCDCGNFVEVIGNHLKRSNTKSCGCLSREVHEISRTKHGDCKENKRSRLYSIWAGMKSRCFTKSHGAYYYYGAKGIEVCLEWKSDYMKFKIWALKNGYQDKLTIDRIDNDGNYEPSNCQWITFSENIKKSNYDRRK